MLNKINEFIALTLERNFTPSVGLCNTITFDKLKKDLIKNFNLEMKDSILNSTKLKLNSLGNLIEFSDINNQYLLDKVSTIILNKKIQDKDNFLMLIEAKKEQKNHKVKKSFFLAQLDNENEVYYGVLCFSETQDEIHLLETIKLQ